jgi:1-deoxy-D-xylulose-5-phosphate reductoisomerase
LVNSTLHSVVPRSPLVQLQSSLAGRDSEPLAISILGSTGSVGRSTVELVASNPDRLSIVGLAAQSNWHLGLEQAKAVKPLVLAFSDEGAAQQARLAEPNAPFKILGGAEGVHAVASLGAAQAVVAAIVGFAGLSSTLAALAAGKLVALANKEAVVCGASLLRKELAKSNGAKIVPVDSEHSALFQALQGNCSDDVKKLWLTASGGPFRSFSKNKLSEVTPEQALLHPTWTMGSKITIDSASLMNKGLELIEACELFGVDETQIGVVVHPESIIHSLVEYCDGSQLAQLSVPDMKGAIGYALAGSSMQTQRLKRCMADLDLTKLGSLNFETLDNDRFPAVQLARQAVRAGGMVPAAFNAANEIAVAAFLRKQISFPAIWHLVENCMDSLLDHAICSDASSYEELKDFDVTVRNRATELLARFN